MRFWDSSAIVPLVVDQASSRLAVQWASEDAAIVIWTLTPVEVVSAIRRHLHEKAIEEDRARAAESRLRELVELCHAVVDLEAVKSLATRLLRVHPLRAFDACQLGAALHWAEGLPEGRTIHTLDGRLAAAAALEGFTVPA